MTPDLAAAVRERLDETERLAQAACRHPQTMRPGHKGKNAEWAVYQEGGADGYAVESQGDGSVAFVVGSQHVAEHIAFHDPAAVLRRVEADRDLLDAHSRPHRCPTPTPCGHTHTDGRPCRLWDDSETAVCFTLQALARGLGIDLEEP